QPRGVQLSACEVHLRGVGVDRVDLQLRAFRQLAGQGAVPAAEVHTVTLDDAALPDDLLRGRRGWRVVPVGRWLWRVADDRRPVRTFAAEAVKPALVGADIEPAISGGQA